MSANSMTKTSKRWILDGYWGLGEEGRWSGEDPCPLFCLKHSWHHLSRILISLHLLSPRIMSESISYASECWAELLARALTHVWATFPARTLTQ